MILRVWAAAFLLLATGAAAWAKVDCVSASRYATLSAITGGNEQALAHGLGASTLPPSQACRAVLLSGQADDQMVSDLLDALRDGRGGVATAYLAFSDGDLASELRLAAAVRSFGLEAVAMRTDLDYVPDFIADIGSAPASVSGAWTEAARASVTPLTERLSDYLKGTDRKISRGGSECGLGCFTVLAAGATRTQIWTIGALKNAPPASQGSAPAEDEALRKRVRSALGVTTDPTWTVKGYLAPRTSFLAPWARNEVEQQCRSRVDYASTRRTEIAQVVTGYVEKSGQFLAVGKLLPMVQAFRRAETSVRTCVAQRLDQSRQQDFQKLCGSGCDNAHLTQTIDAVVSKLRASPGQDGSLGTTPR